VEKYGRAKQAPDDNVVIIFTCDWNLPLPPFAVFSLKCMIMMMMMADVGHGVT
jgi:hypothetical protein